MIYINNQIQGALTPYQKAAKASLRKYYPDDYKTDEAADDAVRTLPFEELDGMVGVKSSMTSAVSGISEKLGLSKEEHDAFLEASLHGPAESPIFEYVKSQITLFSNDDVLDTLSIIHDGWVYRSSDEKTLQKKDKDKLRQYTPLDLLGWDEVLNDHTYLSPVLGAIGVSVDEESLSKAYHARVSQYMEDMNINSVGDIAQPIENNSNYYNALPNTARGWLASKPIEVANQIVNHWQEKDPDTYRIFTNRQLASTDTVSAPTVENKSSKT